MFEIGDRIVPKKVSSAIEDWGVKVPYILEVLKVENGGKWVSGKLVAIYSPKMDKTLKGNVYTRLSSSTYKKLIRGVSKLSELSESLL